MHSGKGRGRSEGTSSTSETRPHTDTLANCFVELIAFWQEVWARGRELNEMAFLRGAWGIRWGRPALSLTWTSSFTAFSGPPPSSRSGPSVPCPVHCGSFAPSQGPALFPACSPPVGTLRVLGGLGDLTTFQV